MYKAGLIFIQRSFCIVKQILGCFLVAGYKFGTTIVPYNEEDQKEYGWKQENRCLKLIQFTKRSQVNEKDILCDQRSNFFRN